MLPNVLLCIRSYNRPIYLSQTIDSIIKIDRKLLYNHKIVIYDDGSDNIETLNILQNISNNNMFEIVKNKKNVGCYKSYVNLLDYISNNYMEQINYVCIIDNDTIVKPDIINKLFSIYLECQEVLKSNNILLSGFNPTNAHLNQTIQIYENFHTRNSVGALCYYFNIEFITEIKKGWLINEDWGICELIKNNNYYLCCVNKGLINHIGIYGLHSNELICDIDSNF
jgi:cellulose synthase/poly-beta-1,6-N-acetylglucosamine synthase-like glycosyltransferase